MRITVIGTGYLGAVHAACMASIGHEVLGMDSDAAKIRQLAQGRSPFFEPGLEELLSSGIRSGRLRFTDSMAVAARFGDVHFICVGTPQLAGSYAADVSAVNATVEALARLTDHDALIVGKSTVPVGTASRLAEIIAGLPDNGAKLTLASNPEFLREGTAVRDTLRPDRLVVGVASPAADDQLRELYAPLISAGVPYISTDLLTSELVKMSANAFLATKVSFINMIADVCDSVGADVVTLATALGYDSRIGHESLRAGLGFGGGCLSKDLRALEARAHDLGAADTVAFLKMVDDTNLWRRRQAVDIAREMTGGSLRDRRAAVLGVAFKPNTDDIRDSPAMEVAAAIQRQGASVRVHDPQAVENARSLHPELTYCASVTDACTGADLVLHLTDWAEYESIDPAALASVVRDPRIFDGRNTLPLNRWQDAGWEVRSFGHRTPLTSPFPQSRSSLVTV